MPVVADELLADAIEALLGRSGETILVLADDRLRIVRAGAGTEGLAERPGDQLTGMSLIAAFGSVALDAIARQAQASGQAAVGESELGRLGARTFSIEAVPLRGGRLVIALHETTSQRRAERIRRDFVANISHELRTPLASIKLLAETLSEGAVEDPQTAHDFTVQIEREVDHLAQLVDELLDLSMIESGETKLAIEPVDAVGAGARRGRAHPPGRRTAWRDGRGGPRRAVRGAARGRRPGAARAGAAQPGAQRGQVQPPGRRGPHRLGSRPNLRPLHGGR